MAIRGLIVFLIWFIANVIPGLKERLKEVVFG